MCYNPYTLRRSTMPREKRADAMHLEHLSLANFRNYARLEIDLPSGVSLMVGANGQGKSNLLEAIYYLARPVPTAPATIVS